MKFSKLKQRQQKENKAQEAWALPAGVGRGWSGTGPGVTGWCLHSTRAWADTQGFAFWGLHTSSRVCQRDRTPSRGRGQPTATPNQPRRTLLLLPCHISTPAGPARSIRATAASRTPLPFFPPSPLQPQPSGAPSLAMYLFTHTCTLQIWAHKEWALFSE